MTKKPNNESLNQKIERIQYSAALTITGAIKGTSQSKLYNELGWCTFHKIKITELPEHQLDFIPETNHIEIL